MLRQIGRISPKFQSGRDVLGACLINLSGARFDKRVKLDMVLCARSINPLERGRPVCGGCGCYGNSISRRGASVLVDAGETLRFMAFYIVVRYNLETASFPKWQNV
jgi:hypothetical protein